MSIEATTEFKFRTFFIHKLIFIILLTVIRKLFIQVTDTGCKKKLCRKKV